MEQYFKMKKVKVEFILIVILAPILVYVGWQAYNTYLKPPAIDLGELEIAEETENESTAPKPSSYEKGLGKPYIPEQRQEKPAPIPKGTFDYTGYIKRDPLEHSLPVKIQEEKVPVTKVSAEKKHKDIKEIKKPAKEIILPKFTITGIVWGKASPSAIIDNKVYRIGDIIKGAKILGITQQGIQMIYQGKEFWVSIQQGG